MATIPERAGEDDSEGRLRSLFDITWEDVRDKILTRAQAHASTYDSRLYPPGTVGSVRYYELVARLRETLLPHGWGIRDDNNIARIVHPGRKLAVVVTSGDRITGYEYVVHGKYPRSKNPKGPATHAVIEASANEPVLPIFEEEQTPVEALDLSTCKTWFLVVHASGKFIQSELSQGLGLEDDYISQWSERILFPMIPVDEIAPILAESEPSVPDYDEIVIPVSER